MTGPIRFYVNGRALDAEPGDTLLSALEGSDREMSEQIGRGDRRATDSRGLPADLTASLYQGAIFRVTGGVTAADRNQEPELQD